MVSTCPAIDKQTARLRAVSGIPKNKDLHPHLDRECLQIGGFATLSRRLKNVTEYMMRIEAKDQVFAPNYLIKCPMSAKQGLGRAYSAYILPSKDQVLRQKIRYWAIPDQVLCNT